MGVSERWGNLRMPYSVGEASAFEFAATEEARARGSELVFAWRT